MLCLLVGSVLLEACVIARRLALSGGNRSSSEFHTLRHLRGFIICVFAMFALASPSSNEMEGVAMEARPFGCFIGSVRFCMLFPG